MLKYCRLAFAIGVCAFVVGGCVGEDDRPIVALIVDPVLADETATARTQFASDLRNDGYDVIETTTPFATPTEVRSYLQGAYDSTSRLVGVILIGDIPRAYQFVTSSHVAEEAISYQYFADLDGSFSASPGYESPGDHDYSFDAHDGKVDWEIWVGVLPSYGGGPIARAQAINRYLEKNHAYRANPSVLPRAFLQVTEHFSAATVEDHNAIVNGMTDGTYSWTPWSEAETALFYFDSPPMGITVNDGYQALSDGAADFFVGEAHGFWRAHGQIDVSWVESHPIRTVFFWSDGCSVGNLDYANNFLSSVLYSETSSVIVAKGTTNNSGGMGTNENGFFGHNIATAMSQGRSFGEAILGHVNVPLRLPWSDTRELHFGTLVVLGDPTLRIPPEPSTTTTTAAATGSE